MGIKFSNLKSEDQEKDQKSGNGDSNSFVGRIFLTLKLFFKGIKVILHKLSFSVFQNPKNRGNPKPILPVVHPTSSILNDHLLVQTHVTSRADQSGPFVEESGSSQVLRDRVIVSVVPDFKLSGFDTCVVTNEVIEPVNVIEEDISVQKNIVACGTGVEDEEEFEEEVDKVVIKNVDHVVIINEVKWIKHYSNSQRILLVGEGDFSFSACLAVFFRQASNMVATSLDSKEFLKDNYRHAPSNIENLRSRGCKVMHGIDATKLLSHALLGLMTFDRIVYNFPFAGFFKDLPRESQLRCHRQLVSLFLKNAKEMISEDGEIHITHKTNAFHNEWKLEVVASSHGLRLIEAIPFHHRDYPGYHTKYGFGGDRNFNCNPSKTFKFGLKNV